MKKPKGLQEKFGKKAFLLTLDSLLALTIVVLVSYSYLMLSSGESEIQKASAYGNLARDYLRVSFKDQWKFDMSSVQPKVLLMDANGFYQATGNNISNTTPKNANFTGHAEIIMYPLSPPPCLVKCNSWTFVASNWQWVRECSIPLTKAEAEGPAGNNGCLVKSDIELAGGAIRKDIWVWKE